MRSHGPLQPWHLLAPNEPVALSLERMRWPDWLRREERAMRFVVRRVKGSAATGRYAAGPPHPAAAWNRTHVLLPDGPPRGAVVLLHGLTDSPWSVRHFALAAQRAGLVAIALRLPGHGTTPAALAKASRRQWIAATAMAMREARRLANGGPVSLLGYSNGAALALHHGLRSLFEPRLVQPHRLILISPMIGVSRHARWAGPAAWPAILPVFEHAAWLELGAEANPCKYTSFPARAAFESQRLTMDVQRLIRRASRAGRLSSLPSLLAFQSALDATVSSHAVVRDLFARLPEAAQAELVLFDVNRGALPQNRALEGLLRIPAAYRQSVPTGDERAAVVRCFPANSTLAQEESLPMPWPRGLLSLSHVALPFPLDDPLYGFDPADGVRRSERGVEPGVVRATANPFFPWMLDKAMKALV